MRALLVLLVVVVPVGTTAAAPTFTEQLVTTQAP